MIGLNVESKQLIEKPFEFEFPRLPVGSLDWISCQKTNLIFFLRRAMAESQLENIHDLSDEVQVYLDPSEEVFFGPVTERERQVRQHLPRRTLHPW